MVLFDVGGPLVAYYSLRSAGLSTVPALLLTGVLPTFGVALSMVRHRRLDVVGVLVLAGIVVRTVLGISTGSAHLVLLEGTVGTAVFGGMILSTVLNLFIVPVVYVAFARIRERLAGRKRTATATAANGRAPAGAVPASVVRTADGNFVLHFSDGSDPVRLTLPD